ncbi:hypothetical protein [Streptomyces chartreusis]
MFSQVRSLSVPAARGEMTASAQSARQARGREGVSGPPDTPSREKGKQKRRAALGGITEKLFQLLRHSFFLAN